MKNKNFLVVFKKEIKDAFRDRKSIIALFIPVIIFPVLFFVMGLGMKGVVEQNETKIALVDKATNEIVLSTDERADFFINQILGNDSTIKVVDDLTLDYKTGIKEGKISLAVMLPENKEIRNYSVVYDDSSTFAGVGMSSLLSKIDDYYTKIANEEIKDSTGKDFDEIKGLTIGSTALSSLMPKEENLGISNPIFQMLVPLLLTMLLAVGGTSVAIDLVAGEKERNTFEPLLSTSASRFNILSAKYLVIIVFSFISAILQLVGMVFGIASSPDFFGSTAGMTINLPIGAIIVSFLNLLMLAGLFSSILLVLSASAKTYKEASTKCGFLIFLPMILAYATMFTEASAIPYSQMFIPIVNVISSIKMIMAGRIDYLFFLTALVVNVIVVGIAVYLTLKSFNKEDLIIRG